MIKHGAIHIDGSATIIKQGVFSTDYDYAVRSLSLEIADYLFTAIMKEYNLGPVTVEAKCPWVENGCLWMEVVVE